jgi:hypothetical protein
MMDTYPIVCMACGQKASLRAEALLGVTAGRMPACARCRSTDLDLDFTAADDSGNGAQRNKLKCYVHGDRPAVGSYVHNTGSGGVWWPMCEECKGSDDTDLNQGEMGDISSEASRRTAGVFQGDLPPGPFGTPVLSTSSGGETTGYSGGPMPDGRHWGIIDQGPYGPGYTASIYLNDWSDRSVWSQVELRSWDDAVKAIEEAVNTQRGRRSSLDRTARARRLASIQRSVLDANPGMSVTAAMDIAERTVARYLATEGASA